MRGKVTMFDKEVGLGEIIGDHGQVFPFHCIAIADGSQKLFRLALQAGDVGSLRQMKRHSPLLSLRPVSA